MTSVGDIRSLMSAFVEQTRRNHQQVTVSHVSSDESILNVMKQSQHHRAASASSFPVNSSSQAVTFRPSSVHQNLPTSGLDIHQIRSALAVLAASSPPDTPPSSSLSPALPATDVLSAAPNTMSSTARSRRQLDRSTSEPTSTMSAVPGNVFEQAGIASGGGLGSGSAAFCRYKTELCRPFEENGTCKYADKCQFAHGRAELRPIVRHPKYKTDLCRTYHTTGLCPYGPRCHFIHNDEERRLNELNRMVIEQQQQQHQRAVLVQAATAVAQQQQQHQQQDMLAVLLAQRQLASKPAVHQSLQQQVDQAFATSLQRSLSLGSSRATVGGYSTGRLGPRSVALKETSAIGDTSMPVSLGCSRGSLDSVTSIGSSPSPTSSSINIVSSPSSSASSDAESPSLPFPRIAGDHRPLVYEASSPSPSPEHFSFPVSYPDDAVPRLVNGSSSRVQSVIPAPVARPQPTADPAVMLTLLAQQMRDAESQQLGIREDDVKAVLAKLLQSATAVSSSSSSRYDVPSTASLGSVGLGRCGSRGAVTNQQWALHGTALTGCNDVMRL